MNMPPSDDAERLAATIYARLVVTAHASGSVVGSPASVVLRWQSMAVRARQMAQAYVKK